VHGVVLIASDHNYQSLYDYAFPLMESCEICRFLLCFLQDYDLNLETRLK